MSVVFYSCACVQVRGVRGYVGQPVLRINSTKLRYGVVVGRELEGESCAGLPTCRAVLCFVCAFSWTPCDTL